MQKPLVMLFSLKAKNLETTSFSGGGWGDFHALPQVDKVTKDACDVRQLYIVCTAMTLPAWPFETQHTGQEQCPTASWCWDQGTPPCPASHYDIWSLYLL